MKKLYWLAVTLTVISWREGSHTPIQTNTFTNYQDGHAFALKKLVSGASVAECVRTYNIAPSPESMRPCRNEAMQLDHPTMRRK